VPGIVLGREAVRVDVRARRVSFDDGSTADYETLVSTIPLPELVTRLADAPDGVRRAGARLRWSSVFAVSLGVRGDRTHGRQWVYVPERRCGFYRVGCYSNAAPSMAPRGCSTLWVEFSHNPHRPLDRRAARREAVAGLQDMGMLGSPRDIETEWLLDMPYAYVTFDAHHARATSAIHRYLARHGIHAIGRYGRWEYSSMEDALLHGRDLARQLLDKDSD
jgi:protoporphyrinogen oxidase